MKILFCDNSLREFINFREDIINYFLSKGHEIVIVAPNNNIDYKNPNIKLISIKIERSGMNPIRDLKYFFNLLRIYRSEKPDYIFHYTIKPNIYGSIAAKLNHIPSTAMIAGLGYVFSTNGLRSKIGRWLYKFAMKFPEHIMVLNQFNKEILLQKKISKETQIILLKGGEGINLKKFD